MNAELAKALLFVLDRVILIVALIVAAFCASRAWAVPELSRAGYFSCAACHVSSAGGDVLTPYGHGIAAERLSTWGADWESEPVKTPSWLLLGADYRAATVDQETGSSSSGVVPIRMQSDLAAAVVLPHFRLEAQGGEVGQTGAADQDHLAMRSYWAQVDAYGVSARAGRFLPRYGLNIPQHVVNTRAALGFDEGDEVDAGELVWLTQYAEVSVTRMVGTRELEGSHDIGWASSIYGNVFGARLGISALTAAQGNQSRTDYGASAIIGGPWTSFVLLEADHQVLLPAGTEQAYFYGRLGLEPIQGVIPFLESQISATDLANVHDRTEAYGIGVQWYPVPHFDLEAEAGPTLNMLTYTFTTQAYVMAHFYL